MRVKTVVLLGFYCITNFVSLSQTLKVDESTPDSLSNVREWFKRIDLSGYMQIRYNGLLETNADLGCEQCDRSWGDGNKGFFFRRIRLKFSGQVHPRVYFYIQPDFASSAGALNYAQIRDAYFDVGLDDKNEFRFRIGQSKVPFGFENMQSSQNRLPLDRNDGLNSAVSNERDIGVFFYWAPEVVRKRYSMLVKEGYKGSGDYGAFGLGVYNGQLANQPEMTDNQHFVARFTYPFKIGNQILEPGVQAYTGKYVIGANRISTGVSHNTDRMYTDQRAAISTVLYPRPFGIQAEYNVGRGPEFNKLTNSIDVSNLHGGYATLSYMIRAKEQLIYPFVRYQHYQGGKKHEQDARSYHINELELGVEWLPFPNFEIVAMYTFSERRYEDFYLRDNFQKGSLVRIQLQVNF